MTLVSDGESVRTESAIYCETPEEQAASSCAESTGRIAVLQVRQGDQVGLDVDRDISEKGWFLVDVDSQQRSAVQDTHYFTFDADFSNRPQAGLIRLEVRSLDRVAEEGAKVLGVWQIQLVQK